MTEPTTCPRCGSELEGLGEGTGTSVQFCPRCGWTSNATEQLPWPRPSLAEGEADASSAGEQTDAEPHERKTPEEGMREAAEGMETRVLEKRYEELARHGTGDQGNELAREVIRKELNEKRHVPIP